MKKNQFNTYWRIFKLIIDKLYFITHIINGVDRGFTFRIIEVYKEEKAMRLISG
jgi:hypothetical protein